MEKRLSKKQKPYEMIKKSVEIVYHLQNLNKHHMRLKEIH